MTQTKDSLTTTQVDAILSTFETDEWGIPILDINKQLTYVDKPIAWGDIARTSKHDGLYFFYIPDYKFYNLIKRPMKLIDSGCYGIVEPNFSANVDMARAVVLYYIFQKRTIARLCQHFDIDVAVDLCIEPKFYDLALLGVPKGWRSYAVRGYTRFNGDNLKAFGLACNHANSLDINFFVYGGGKEVQAQAWEMGWRYIPEKMDKVNGRA